MYNLLHKVSDRFQDHSTFQSFVHPGQMYIRYLIYVKALTADLKVGPADTTTSLVAGSYRVFISIFTIHIVYH